VCFAGIEGNSKGTDNGIRYNIQKRHEGEGKCDGPREIPEEVADASDE